MSAVTRFWCDALRNAPTVTRGASRQPGRQALQRQCESSDMFELHRTSFAGREGSVAVQVGKKCWF